jgi:hypothetical protein
LRIPTLVFGRINVVSACLPGGQDHVWEHVGLRLVVAAVTIACFVSLVGVAGSADRVEHWGHGRAMPASGTNTVEVATDWQRST